MKRTVLAFAILFGLFAAGCDDPPTGSAAPSGSGTAVALSDADLPVPADFEEEAEKGISASNYKSELDSLEKEVDSK